MVTQLGHHPEFIICFLSCLSHLSFLASRKHIWDYFCISCCICSSKAAEWTPLDPCSKKTTLVAWVMENSLDRDLTKLAARLQTNTGHYVLPPSSFSTSYMLKQPSKHISRLSGWQDISSSSSYILTNSISAPHISSLQTLEHPFPSASPIEMQLVTVFPVTSSTSCTTTRSMCRMDEHWIQMLYE